MTPWSHHGVAPRIDARAWVHPSAQLIGDVIVEPYASVGPGAVLWADTAAIIIGEGSCVEDLCNPADNDRPRLAWSGMPSTSRA